MTNAQARRSVPLRTRLAMDLHDDVMASLAGLAMHLGAAERRLGEQPSRAVLQDARAHVARVLSVVRGYVDDLDPPRAAGRGRRRPGDLPAVLAALATEVRASSGAQLRVSLSPAALAMLSPAASRALIATAREAVGNSVRHGRARTVWISLSDAEHGTLMTIRDDGVGFVLRGPGRGLRNIAVRAAALGGQAVVTTRPGLGTLVWVTIPKIPAAADGPGVPRVA
jgi:signal transduction histidine kinase